MKALKNNICLIVSVFCIYAPCLSYPELFKAISKDSLKDVEAIVKDFRNDEITLKDNTIVKHVLNERDFYGRTPLIYAIVRLGMPDSDKEQLKEIIAYLIENGADVNRTDKREQQSLTPLYWASNVNNKEVFQLLVDKKADIDALNINNVGRVFTVLMDRSSIINNEADWIKFIIKNKADINKKNNLGQTALMIAVARDNLETVKLLKCFGANIFDIIDHNGDNAYDIALQGNNDEIIQILQTTVLQFCDI